MDEPSHDPGIENEPQFAHRRWEEDPSESRADRNLPREHRSDSDIEHSVWDEPALSPDLSLRGQPSGLTYRNWLLQNIEQTTWLKSWLSTLLIALAAGPWGVIGALGSGGASFVALLAVVVFGPITEEVTKVAAALWVVEKRPYLFRSGAQILICAACGGLAFAAIENLIYLYIYVPEHSPQFVAFRWTVCVALHMTCSTLAGQGLKQIWRDAVFHLHRPNLRSAHHGLLRPWCATVPTT